MSETAQLPHFEIKLNGSSPPDAMLEAITDTVVETNLHLPAMFFIRLIDPELEYIDSPDLAVGVEVEIKMEDVVLINGEITALEPDLAQATPVVQVRGYDRAHRLHRGRHREAYVQMTDSDLASQIAGEVGLSSQVDSTSEVFEYIYQNNLTHWEFLQERAGRIGYDCYVQGEELYFKSMGQARDGTVNLEWGNELTWLRPRLSSSAQVTEVIVRGWDPGAKEAIVGQVTPRAEAQPSVGAGLGSDEAESAFDTNAQMVIVDRPVYTQGEAESMAQAVADDLGGSYLQAEGEALGNPNLQAGRKVNITGVGERFSGEYFVTRATHSYGTGAGYNVRFSVTGRRPSSIGALLAGRRSLPDSRVPGVVPAIVTNNEDPDGLGRVKVKYPVFSDDIESDWVRVASPMAGPERGFYWLPEVDDEVLIAFEFSDVRRPYVIGALWNGQDAPPEDIGSVVSGGEVVQRIIKTRVGHLIILEDTAGAEAIKIIDKTGDNQVLIESDENKITLQAAGDIVIEAQGKVLVSGQGGVEIDSQAHFKAESQSGAEIKTTANLKVHGATSEVSADTAMTIKGSIVKLN
jgi:phage protein D/phage baseplate assembly protein gpV